MKKILVCLLTLILLFSFTACALISAKENSSEITKTDFSKYIARFSDTDTPEGPCYTVNIENINNETKEIEFPSFSQWGFRQTKPPANRSGSQAVF